MVPRLLRSLPTSPTQMARAFTCATFTHFLSSPTLPKRNTPFQVLPLASPLGRKFHALCGDKRGSVPRPVFRGGFVWVGSERGYRKVRRQPTAFSKKSSKEKQVELSVSICHEEELPDDPEILSIAELLRLNVPMALKLALDGLKDSPYKTRDKSISDIAGFECIELSVLLCNDEFIRKLNKDWRDEDHATDVLSMSQHVPELKLPVLMLGDIVISVETAARQAWEREHSLLDEIRILVVHGLLHLLGFDHEISEEAEAEMEKEEALLLKCLGWKGKGLIHSAYDAETNANLHTENSDGKKKEVFDSTNQSSTISSVIWMELYWTAKAKFPQQTQ